MKIAHLIASLLLVVSFIFGCKKQDPLAVGNLLNGMYKGSIVVKKAFSLDSSFNNWTLIDTINLSFEIDGSNFIDGNCIGDFKIIDSENIRFNSDECGCWCDCDPRVDCSGHFLLGQHEYIFEADSLKMINAGVVSDSMSFPGVVQNYYYDYGYYFKKQ